MFRGSEQVRLAHPPVLAFEAADVAHHRHGTAIPRCAPTELAPAQTPCPNCSHLPLTGQKAKRAAEAKRQRQHRNKREPADHMMRVAGLARQQGGKDGYDEDHSDDAKSAEDTAEYLHGIDIA